MRLLVTCVFVAIASWSATAAQAEELKVAYLPCGNVNDKSWTQVGYEGVLAAQKALAKSGMTMKLDYTESLSPAQVERRPATMPRAVTTLSFCIAGRLRMPRHIPPARSQKRQFSPWKFQPTPNGRRTFGTTILPSRKFSSRQAFWLR